MILFQEDWARERASVHYETENKSFIKIAMILRKLGINNWAFPLALIQKDLVGHDPLNLKDPSKDLRRCISLEAKINPWYFFREICRVPASGSGAISFKANRANIAMIWCFYNNIHYMAIQPRQTGKAAPLTSLIKTPDGWISMGDVKIGTMVSTPDGKTSHVIGIYPQGIKPIYRITFEDGRSTECCDEHLWKVCTSDTVNLNWTVITLRHIKKLLNKNINVFIPRVKSEIEETGKKLLKIESIEYVGKKEAQCIEIDHPDHLYITDNFIVTHNTVSACAIMTHVMYISGINIEITLYTKDSALVHANVARIKTIREALPDYLIYKQVRDTDNKEGLSYEILKNRYRTAIAKDSKQDADNLGRGMTSPVCHGDEPAFCNNIEITYPVMMLSTVTAVQNAKANGQPHSNIFTTTAAPIDTPRGRFTYDLVNKAMPFTETMYDLQNKEEAYRLVHANSTNDMINGTFSYLMLGLTHEWYEQACRLSGASKEVNDRELLNEWKSGTDTSILDPDIIKILTNNKHEPNYTEIINEYVVRWYLPRDVVSSPIFLNKRYILGMDSSENIGQDFTTLVLIDISDMSVAATFRCNESNTIKIAMFIAEFLMMYTNVTFIPERNSTGGAIIDMVAMVFQRNKINPFRRIYNEIVQKRNDPEFDRINIDDPSIIDTSLKKYLGFRTTGKSRPYLYKNTLRKAASMNATRIRDTTLIGELLTLSASNGRIDHVEGGHDDMVIAYLLACWLIFFGENLNYYGINVCNILTNITSDGNVIDPVHRDRQLELRRQIKFYQDRVEATESEIIKRTYMQKIMLLQSQIDPNVNFEPIGISKVNQEVTEFGKNVYTPVEFSTQTKIKQNSAQRFQNLTRLI